MDTLSGEFGIGFAATARDEAREMKELMRPRRWWGEKRWSIISCELPRLFSRWPCDVAFQSTEAANVGVDVEQIFYGLAEKWKRETGALSIMSKRYKHRSYKAILGLGRGVVPVILRELQKCPDWWFDALRFLAGEDAAKDAANVDEAVAMWLSWGKRNFPNEILIS